MNPFIKPLSVFGMVGSTGIFLVVMWQSLQAGTLPVLALLLAGLLVPSIWGHFTLQFRPKPAELMIRVALSLNSCWLVLHILRLYTRAGEGHLIDWSLHLPALGVCIANIVTFSVHRIKKIKASRGPGGTGRSRR